MVHQYQLNGYNIVLDICSGSVHAVDELAYDIIAMFETESRDMIIRELTEKYRSTEGVTPEELAKTRHELLATKPADLAAMAGVLRKYAREGKFCTFSGANGGA